MIIAAATGGRKHMRKTEETNVRHYQLAAALGLSILLMLAVACRPVETSHPTKLTTAGGESSLVTESQTWPSATSTAASETSGQSTTILTSVSSPSTNESTTATTAPTLDSEFISTDKAQQIAVDYVGHSSSVVSIVPDFTENPPVYDLELVDTHYEYWIKIHAITGAILEFEKEEIDDEHTDELDDKSESD
jgi:hypothetical protein